MHDVTNPRPPGGARTAAAFAAMLAAGGAVTWHDATGAEHEWTDAGGAAVYAWDAWPAVPANQTLELRAAAAAGAAEVTIGGLWPSNLRAIAAGDYVQIEHWLYLASADVASDADGVATVAITPTLWRAAPAGAVVRLDCAATIMRLDTRDVVWSRAARERRSPFSLTLREVLPTEGVP